jgi:hypothetical protein
MGLSQETIAKAREFFEMALAVDANNSQALAGLASITSADQRLYP